LLLGLAAALCGCGGGGSSGGAQPTTQAQANRAPTITGSPPTVAYVNVPFAFTPASSDADGDVLTFGIQNKPSWAEFDSSTGRLAGLPRLGDLGLVSSVTISVSDGKATTSLATFSLTVRNPPGTATLSWVAPTTNTDGTALVDLAGYRIYSGTDPADVSRRIDVTDPRVSTYAIEGLSAGRWYFAMTSINAAGLESARTGLVSLDVQ
jgi:hypothetical protein